MSNAMLNIYVRVIKRRMADGEEIDAILADYIKLTDSEISQIRGKLSA